MPETPPNTPPETKQDQEQPFRRRLRFLGLHFFIYFVLISALFMVNIFTPGSLWFVLPMLGWGTALALHTAYVMGLFEIFRSK